MKFEIIATTFILYFHISTLSKCNDTLETKENLIEKINGLSEDIGVLLKHVQNKGNKVGKNSDTNSAKKIIKVTDTKKQQKDGKTPILLKTCSNWTYKEQYYSKNMFATRCKTHEQCGHPKDCGEKTSKKSRCRRICEACERGPYFTSLPYNKKQSKKLRRAFFSVRIGKPNECSIGRSIDFCVSLLYRIGNIKSKKGKKTQIKICVHSHRIKRRRCMRLKRKKKEKNLTSTMSIKRFQFSVPCDKFQVTVRVDRGRESFDVDEANFYLGRCNDIKV